MADVGSPLNGGFNKFLVGVMIVLLTAAVIGVWQMNSNLSALATDMDWLKDAVKSNTARLNAITGPRP